jgi:hypothetical protein
MIHMRMYNSSPHLLLVVAVYHTQCCSTAITLLKFSVLLLSTCVPLCAFGYHVASQHTILLFLHPRCAQICCRCMAASVLQYALVSLAVGRSCNDMEV